MFGLALQQAALDAAHAAAGLAANWLVQSTLLVAMGLAAARLLERRGSAVQSAVYRTTLLAAALCPAASCLLSLAGFSGWALPLPAAYSLLESPQPVESTAAAVDTPVSSANDGYMEPSLPTSDELPPELANSTELPRFEGAGSFDNFASLEAENARVANTPIDSPEPTGEPSATLANSTAPPTAVIEHHRFGAFAVVAALLWTLIGFVLLARLVASCRRLGRIRRGASPAADSTLQLCRQVAARLNVGPPAVLHSPYLPSPCLAGILRPAVMLPAEEADEASPPLQDVLVHELAHLRRRDCHWNLLRRVTVAVLWFQPLLWLLSRRLETTAEEVCDDYVVHFGGDRRHYARRLVDIAELSATPFAAAGVAMVSIRSMLERRVLRVMDTSRSLSTRVGSVLLVLVLIAGALGTTAVSLVGIGVQTSEAGAQSSEDEGGANADDPAATETESSATASAGQEAMSLAATKCAGTVIAPNGQPAAGADVYLIYHVPQPTGLLQPTWKPIIKTNAEGKFRFTLDETTPEYASLVAVKEGFGFAWSELALHETSGRLLSEAKARAEKVAGFYREHLLERLKRAGRPLQLIADDEPLRGRIVDINGQPVAGARLTLTEVAASLDGDLSAWRAAAGEPKADYYSARAATPLMMNGPQVRSLVKPAATDADGRFTLAGIGRGRIVTLLLEGPGIEAAKVLARTEAGEPIELERERRVPHGTYVYHPAEFTHIAGPSVPIVGVVRDEQTKAPLAGVTVKSQTRHGEVISGWGQDFVRAVTDDEGRYRLHGMPIGEENRIAAVAPDDKPYLSMSAEAPTLAGQESATIDFDLHRGVWIEGRVTDKHTGEGLAGTLKYFVPRDNPNYGRGRSMNVDERDRLQADQDGRYRIVGFSGRGYVAFMAEKHEQYPRADHVILADGSRKKVDGYLTDTEPSYLMAANYHAVTEINPAERAERHELNLQLDSGGIVTGRVVDADGRPVSGFYYSGRLAEFEAWRPGDNDAFDVTGYDASEGRDVYVVQRQRNLAGHVRITGEPTRALTVTLQPAGTVKGRVVDESGAPLANLALVRWSSPIASPADINKVRSAPPLPLASESTQLGEYETDAEGRFEIPGLVPGVEYRISVFDRESMRPTPARTPRLSGPLDRVIVVKPGETLELGDVGIAERDKFAAAEKAAEKPTGAAGGSEQAEPAAATDAAQPKPSPPPAVGRNDDAVDNATDAKRDAAVTGRVTDDQGRPIAGAKLYGIAWSLRGPQPEPQLLATTDKSGDFSFPRPAMQFNSGEPGARRPNYQFVVTAASHGMRLLRTDELTRPAPNVLGAIAQALSGATPKTSLVELPSAVPIRGRVVDVDGQPVAGVRATLRKITKQNDPLLDMTRQSLPAGQQPENLDWQARVLSLERQFYPAKLPAVAPSATSDAEGRFTLNGIGAESVAELLIEGPGIQSDRVLVRAASGEALTVKADGNFQLEDRVLNGAEFVHVAGPSKPVAGRVLDFDTGAPIADAVVRAYAVHGERLSSSRERQHLLAVTDQEGRYEITGLPVGDGNRLVAFTDGDVPYVPLGAVADTSQAQGTLALDFQLKRGVWAKGKAYDAQTKAPLTGELTYYIPIDPKLKEELPGLRLAFVDEHYFTSAQGEFRVPALAGRGILAFRYDPAGMGDSAQYPRGMGADAIEGFNSDGGLPMLETWPHYLVPANYHLVKEIRPHEGAESVTVDMPLSRGKDIVVHPVDENGQRLAGVEYYGRNDASLFVTAEDDACQVINLIPGEKRKLFFYHRSRNLAGAVVVDENTSDGAEVTLRPAATITGRLVDEDGALIDDATIIPTFEKLREDERAAMWPPADPEATSGTDQVSAAGGAFRIVGLVPGWKYNAWASAPRKLNGMMQSMGIGRVFDDLELAPGEERNLGDLVVSYEEETAASKPKSKPPEDDKRPENEPSSTGRPPGVQIHGQVRGPNGEPLGGVHVAVVSIPITVRRGGDYGISEAPVFETTTDDGGRYELQLTGLSPDTHPYSSLVVRAPELGLAWQRIDLNKAEVELSFQLEPEQPIVVRLVDIEGQPAAGVGVTVSGIMPTISGTRQSSEDGVGIWGGVKAPAAWFPPVTTSDSGELVIRHVPANHGVNLKIAPHERFAPQDLAINTGMPEQRGERDATYRSQVINNVKPGNVPSIPLSPAQWFTGLVTYEDTGEPAPHARVTIWASQQQYGSMSTVAGTADANGRYRINPEPGIRFGITAYPPDGAAYMPRQMEPVSWDAGDQSKTVDVALPRGVLVRGQMIEEGSHAPVAGASVQYLPEMANNKSVPENTITGWQDRRITDAVGRFETVVPPGPGRLLVHGPRNDYQIVQLSSREISRGRPGGERNYVHAVERIDPAPNAEPQEVTLQLKRGGTVTGELVDVEGELIESALLISRLTIHANWLDWHAHTSRQVTGGRFEIGGLTPGEEYNVLFLDPQHKRGAIAILKAGMTPPRIVLQPCGRVVMRLVDRTGTPVAGKDPTIKLIVTPGADEFDREAMQDGELAADADFISNADRLNHQGFKPTDADGRLEIDALIPGATYRIVANGDRQELKTTDFVARSGETVDLGEIVMELRD